jgi:hypothetical protein
MHVDEQIHHTGCFNMCSVGTRTRTKVKTSEIVQANSHMPCRDHAVPMPCHAPGILRQCRLLRKSSRGSRKYPNCQSYSLTNWYASGNNLRGTPRGSRKKPNTGRSPTCRLWTADANSHMPRQTHAAPKPRCAVALRSRFQNGMIVAWLECDMECVNQTRQHCVNQTGRHNLNS